MLRAFNDDIGGLIKSNAPAKLVFSGQRGIYDFTDGLAGLKLAHASPGIDVCSLHAYDYDHQGSREPPVPYTLSAYRTRAAYTPGSR